MDDLIGTIAKGTGIDKRLATKGLALVLSHLRQELPGEAFARISRAIPNENQLLESASTNTFTRGPGLAIDPRKPVGNLWGEKVTSGQNLATQLADAGFSDEAMARFVAGAMTILRKNVPPDVATQISKALPGMRNTRVESEGARILAFLKKLM